MRIRLSMRVRLLSQAIGGLVLTLILLTNTAIAAPLAGEANLGQRATVTIDQTKPLTISQLSLGVTHTKNSADSWGNPAAVASARQLLRDSSRFQNQHIMGWGALNPEPAPGVYDWETLDDRLALIRQTGGIPVITLAGAPDWMKGGAPGATNWSKLEVAPTPDHYADFAELARQVALRYRDVKYFQVWNELKGFYLPAENRWDYAGYTTMYNLVYDALKSVDPTIQVGGPYVAMDSWSNRATMSNPSNLGGPYGTLDQRALDVITYWLANKRGADFITVDGGAGNKDNVALTDEFTATQKFADVTAWIRQRTDLPIWWAEWYSTPWGSKNEWDHDHQNAVLALTLIQMAKSGAAVALRWQPEGVAGAAYQGNTESLWSSTRVAGGGQPFPFFFTSKALHDFFGPGTPLYASSATLPQVATLAAPGAILLVNTATDTVRVTVQGADVTLAPYEVRLLTTP